MSDVIFGIDVSEHNGAINWDKVKESGKVGFAMLRAGYGKGVIDKQFQRNASECNRLDIPIGVYWFSYAKNAEEAENEAEYCLSAISKYRIDYPVAFDFEDDSVRNCQKCGISIAGKEFATMLALNFLSVILNAGYKPTNYTNPAYLNQYFDAGRLSCYDLWLAQWPSNPNPEKRPSYNPHIWQYSSTGRIPGISTPVDMNVCYVDYLPKKVTVVPSIMTQAWAQNAVNDAITYQISDGSRPDALATRVEVMAMVTRAIDFLATEFNNNIKKCAQEEVTDALKGVKVIDAVNEVLKATGYSKYIESQDDGK